MVSKEEIELVRRAAAGDTVARAKLLPEDYITSLYRYAAQRVHSGVEAEDLVLEALALVIQKLSTFRGEAAFRTWVRKFVDNKIREARRKRQLYHADALTEEFDARPATDLLYRDPLLIALGDEALREIQMAYLRLNPEEQTALRLYRCHELSAKEVAAQMGRTEAAVTSLVQRAIQKMHGFLRDYYPERAWMQQSGARARRQPNYE